MILVTISCILEKIRKRDFYHYFKMICTLYRSKSIFDAMKTVLIIEPVVSELESIMNFCQLSSEELTTISARDHQRSLTILAEKQIDLILCSTSFPDSVSCRVINDLAKAFIYIPIIAISESPEDDQGLALSSGASACFKKPLENETLLDQITELADASKLGMSGESRSIHFCRCMKMMGNPVRSTSFQTPPAALFSSRMAR